MAFFLFVIIACAQTAVHVISIVNLMEVVSREQAMSELAVRDVCQSQAKEMVQLRASREQLLLNQKRMSSGLDCQSLLFRRGSNSVAC